MIIPEGYAQINMIFNGPAVPSGAEMTFGINLDSTTAGPAEVASFGWLN